jgi:peroxiredoxin
MMKWNRRGTLFFLSATLAAFPAHGQSARELMDAGRETLGKPAPELISAGWVGSPVTLRGVKGNTVVLNFWNGDTAYFSSPEYFIRSMMADYEKYCHLRNVTYISICRSMTATLKQVEKDVEQYKIHPFPTMLDAGGATSHAYKVPKEYSTWIVIIDPEGKIIYNRNKGWTWSDGPDVGKQVHHTKIEDSQKKSPGILDRKEIPEDGLPAAHLYDLQQFQAAELEIKKLEKKSPDSVKEFSSYLHDKIAETRKKRLEEIQQMSGTAPFQAYREAVAFVAAFPTCPERGPMNEIGKSLAQNSTVKKELQAEDAYRRIILPELVKVPKGTAEFTQRVQPALDGYLKMYGGTEYAAAVIDGVEGYKLAAARSR